MATFDTWESYFWAPPDDTVLRNTRNERDPEVLRRLEYGSAFKRQQQIERGLVQTPRSFDTAHLQALHSHLFQDLYEWAGQYRTITMRRGTAPGGFADPSEIARYLADASKVIHATRWPQLDLDQFAIHAATTYSYLNQAHPFRDGNGRASKLFMEHVAQLGPFTLDYSAVTPQEWNQASMLSGPDYGTYAPHPESLLPVFRRLVKPRDQKSTPDGDFGPDDTPHPNRPHRNAPRLPDARDFGRNVRNAPRPGNAPEL